jgi:uncharacterized protein involved in exopolysaccharide biosynthesis
LKIEEIITTELGDAKSTRLEQQAPHHEVIAVAKRQGSGRGDAEVSLLDLLIVLARRWRALLAGTAAIAAVAAIVSLLLPSRYTATTVILPPQQSTSSSALLLGQLGGLSPLASLAGGSLGLKNPNDLQVSMLKTRTVEDAMIDRFKLMALYRDQRRSDARKDFEKYTDIENGLKDGLIRVSVTDKDPKRAAEMANAYVDEFKKFSATIAVTEASQRRLFFEQQLVQAKENLAGAEEALKRTQQKTGLIQLDGQARAVIESVARMRGQVAAKEVQILAMRQFAADQNPDLQLAEQELAGLKSQLSHMGAGHDVSSGDFLMPKGSVPEAGLDYIRRLRDVKYNETVFELLAKQLEIAKIDEARQGSIVQVVDYAVEPDKRSSPKRLLILICATIGGFVLMVLWALFSETLRMARKDPAQRAQLDLLARSFR